MKVAPELWREGQLLQREDVDVFQAVVYISRTAWGYERRVIWLGDWPAFWAGVDAEMAYNEFLNSVTEAYEAYEQI